MSQDSHAGFSPYNESDSYYNNKPRPKKELPASVADTAEYKKVLQEYGDVSCEVILKHLNDSIQDEFANRTNKVAIHDLKNAQTVPVAQLSMMSHRGFDENTKFRSLIEQLIDRKSEYTIRKLIKLLTIFKYQK